MTDLFKCPEDLKQQVKLPPDEAIQWGVCFAKVAAVVMFLSICFHAPTFLGVLFLSSSILASAIGWVLIAFVFGVFLKLRKIKKNESEIHR